jgi:hypothetical protein
MFCKYYLITTLIGSYIYGYETSIMRNKLQDIPKFFQYIIASPVTVPYYIYKNGIPRHD